MQPARRKSWRPLYRCPIGAKKRHIQPRALAVSLKGLTQDFSSITEIDHGTMMVCSHGATSQNSEPYSKYSSPRRLQALQDELQDRCCWHRPPSARLKSVAEPEPSHSLIQGSTNPRLNALHPRFSWYISVLSRRHRHSSLATRFPTLNLVMAQKKSATVRVVVLEAPFSRLEASFANIAVRKR